MEIFFKLIKEKDPEKGKDPLSGVRRTFKVLGPYPTYVAADLDTEYNNWPSEIVYIPVLPVPPEKQVQK
jgi:hypothetical protein